MRQPKSKSKDPQKWVVRHKFRGDPLIYTYNLPKCNHIYTRIS